jgi:hypothetical protein
MHDLQSLSHMLTLLHTQLCSFKSLVAQVQNRESTKLKEALHRLTQGGFTPTDFSSQQKLWTIPCTDYSKELSHHKTCLRTLLFPGYLLLDLEDLTLKIWEFHALGAPLPCPSLVETAPSASKKHIYQTEESIAINQIFTATPHWGRVWYGSNLAGEAHQGHFHLFDMETLAGSQAVGDHFSLSLLARAARPPPLVPPRPGSDGARGRILGRVWYGGSGRPGQRTRLWPARARSITASGLVWRFLWFELSSSLLLVWFGVWSLAQGQLTATTNVWLCLIRAEPRWCNFAFHRKRRR